MQVVETKKGGVFYGLDDSADLYRKCVRDLQRCQTSTSNQEKIYALFDLAVGLDHLFEWVSKEIKGTMAEEECKKRFSFNDQKKRQQRQKSVPSSSPLSRYGSLQALVNQVSNGFKHMRKATSFEEKSVAMTFGCGAEDSKSGNYYFQCRQNNYAIFSMVFVGGTNFEPICADLVKHWGAFFHEVLGRELIA